MILAADATGSSTAMITAFGGVVVSLATVYLNSKKQSTATGDNKDKIDVLIDKVSALETENVSLKTKLDRCSKNKKKLATKPVKKATNK